MTTTHLAGFYALADLHDQPAGRRVRGELIIDYLPESIGFSFRADEAPLTFTVPPEALIPDPEGLEGVEPGGRIGFWRDIDGALAWTSPIYQLTNDTVTFYTAPRQEHP
jgi:hypothetical protein